MQDRDRIIQSLLSNDNFVQWVRSPDEQSDEYWQQWMQQHYERKEIAEEARRLILTLNFETVALSAAQKELLKKRIRQSVGSKEIHGSVHKVPGAQRVASQKSIFISWRTWPYAAAISVLILAATFYLANNMQDNGKVVQQTAYGETSSLVLPDGSAVMLNANSTLAYWPDWDKYATREVWLQGEAFFSVEQINLPAISGHNMQDELQKVKLIVHTDNLDIEVVGTRFNVRSRRGDTEVTLNSGKVKLNSKGSTAVSNVFMKPGDHAQFTAKNGFGIKSVDPETYSSWRNDFLVFTDKSLGEIGQIIEDTYGYQVTILNDSLKNKKVNTNLSHGDVEKFCHKLEEIVADLEITLNQNTIIMNTK